MASNNKTHQNIVDASYKLFSEYGFDKTSLSMIAAEVGITKPAIYYHFASKEALIDYLFEDSFKDYHFEAYFTIDEFTSINFQEMLIENGLRILLLEDEDDSVMRILNEFLLTITRNENYHKRLLQMQEDFLNGFSELLEKGVTLGVVSPMNITARAHVLAMVFDNISSYMLMGLKLDYRLIWIEAVNNAIR
ncbi:TetR/AcrR family transcriptional regulator [Paenibacillus glacialis]|uniref:TetR family transcriptional regulator n=1 Tax=Paenibacillus glacialis TaxID=494026 RepID=A0A162KAD4_9BACL|nr:TetR/AcrR family transcriptional regulator [Paenibacillus glacialis]OAB42858.1 TetR family transcriptional regulator [Paenibacillus glacialis]